VSEWVGYPSMQCNVSSITIVVLIANNVNLLCMAIHNDSVNEIHIVLLILHWQVCFPFVYLQNASFNPHSSSV